ncbi:MAG: hypothetical protein ABJB66_11715 [Gemmatimonadaceae bacterium]
MRRAVALISVVMLVLTSTRTASSQAASRDSIKRDSISASPDSVAARLARLEKELALLRRQLGDETRTATHTHSRFGLILRARLQLNMFANDERVNIVDIPQFVLASPSSTTVDSPGRRSFAMSLRQSRIGATLSADTVLGAKFDGDIDIDFSGGTSTGPGDRKLFPEPRLRVARAQLHWKRTELLFGSETPLISDLNPISLAAVAFPEFVGAGNLWNWLPQIRVTRELLGPTDEAGLRIAVQGAVLSPYSSSIYVAETDAVDAGERSGRPFLESRVRARWGSADNGDASEGEVQKSGGEIGIGGHFGWVFAVGDTLQHSQAIAADLRAALGKSIEIRGEIYKGQLLRGLGGAAIGQNFGRALANETLGPTLRDVAGWIQLNAEPHPTLVVGLGCGFDSINSNGRPVRSHNSTCAAHVEYRPMQPVFFAFEVRGIRTHYTTQSFGATHVNLAMGFEW